MCLVAAAAAAVATTKRDRGGSNERAKGVVEWQEELGYLVFD